MIKITAETDRTEKKKFIFLLTMLNQNNFGCYPVKKSTVFADSVIFKLSVSVAKSLAKL